MRKKYKSMYDWCDRRWDFSYGRLDQIVSETECLLSLQIEFDLDGCVVGKDASIEYLLSTPQ